MIEINRNPTRRELTVFGFIWLGFFLLVAGGLWLKHSPAISITLGIVALVVPALGWVIPSFTRLVYVGMSYVAWPVGFVVSHVLLGAVYYLFLTPIGLIMRTAGYDPMHRRFDREARTYWVERDAEDRDPRSYFRQF
jgi:hypothetical protein